MTLAVAFELAQGGEGREHGGRTSHVHLHEQVHRVAGLQAHATGVVHDPFAHHAQMPGGCTLGGESELEHSRFLGAAGVDAEQPAAAEFDQLLFVELLHVETETRPQVLRDLAETGRGEVAGRRVAQVAGDIGGTCGDPARRQTAGGRFCSDSSGPQLQQRQRNILRFTLEHVEAVTAQQCTLGQRLAQGRRVRPGDGRHVEADPCVACGGAHQ